MTSARTADPEPVADGATGASVDNRSAIARMAATATTGRATNTVGIRRSPATVGRNASLMSIRRAPILMSRRDATEPVSAENRLRA